VIETFALGARCERVTYPTHDLAKGSYSDLRGSPEFPNAGGKQPQVEGQSPTCLGMLSLRVDLAAFAR